MTRASKVSTVSVASPAWWSSAGNATHLARWSGRLTAVDPVSGRRRYTLFLQGADEDGEGRFGEGVAGQRAWACEWSVRKRGKAIMRAAVVTAVFIAVFLIGIEVAQGEEVREIQEGKIILSNEEHGIKIHFSRIDNTIEDVRDRQGLLHEQKASEFCLEKKGLERAVYRFARKDDHLDAFVDWDTRKEIAPFRSHSAFYTCRP